MLRENYGDNVYYYGGEINELSRTSRGAAAAANHSDASANTAALPDIVRHNSILVVELLRMLNNIPILVTLLPRHFMITRT